MPSNLRRRSFPIVALAALGVILIGAVRLPAQAAPPDALAAAIAAERAGRYEDAVRDYEKFLAADTVSPTSAQAIEARTRLATALFMLHRYVESLQALQPLPFDAQSRPGSAPRAPAGVAIPAQAWLVKGLDSLELNRLPAAISALRETLALNAESGTARLALGDALARSGRLEEAADTYHEQLQRTPGVADAWYKLGVVCTQLAQKLSKDLVGPRINGTLALQLAAEQLADGGDAWGAARILLPVVHPGPSPSSHEATMADAAEHREARASAAPVGLHADLGAVLLELGYPHAAEEEFKTELLGDPASLPALLGTAEVDALRSNSDGAIDTFQRLMTLYPNELARRLESPPPAPLSEAWKQGQAALPSRLAASPAGKLWTAWLANNGLEVVPPSGSSGGPCSQLTPGKQRAPGYWLSEACYGALRSQLESPADRKLNRNDELKLIEAEYRLGDYQQARDRARALRKTSPDEPWAGYWLAKSYAGLAGQCFDKLAALNSNSPRTREVLARYYSEHHQLAAARREYQAALRLAPDLPDLHMGLGTVYWEEGDWKRAEDELKKTLHLSPGSAVASYELGDCYIQQHEWQQSALYLRRALTNPTVQNKATLDLAKAEAELGDNGAAIRHLSQVAAGDRDGEVHYRLAMLYRKTGESSKAQEALATSEALRKASAQSDRQQLETLEHARESFEHVDHAARQ